MMKKELKELRKENGYSIQEVANIISATEQEINMYESRPECVPLSKAVELVSLYNTTLSSIKFN